MKRIIVIGAGFAGLWAALGAAKKRQELSQDNALEIVVINKTLYHDIRVRNYEDDLEVTRILLKKLLDPVNVKIIIGEVKKINQDKQTVLVTIESEEKDLEYAYDRLVLAAGSQLYYPNVPGLEQYSFNIDTYSAAKKLESHLKQLPQSKNHNGRYTVVVVGGGFTGLELVSELPNRLRNIIDNSNHSEVKVILIDHSEIASTLGQVPQPTILEALDEMGIDLMPNTRITALKKDGILLESSEFIPTQTVIWTVGMRANPLTSLFSDTKDNTGRIIVDKFLQMPQTPHCFAAGDVACANVNDQHTSVMSCQHGRPQGRIAGHNVVADLYSLSMIPYHQEAYVTCLDLGPWGALYMQGWEREITHTGHEAKKIKQYINHDRIYPPLTECAEDLLTAAAPIIHGTPKECFSEKEEK